MFRRQRPVETKVVVPPALVFTPTCDVPGRSGKAGHHHEWELGNAGRFHKFHPYEALGSAADEGTEDRRRSCSVILAQPLPFDKSDNIVGVCRQARGCCSGPESLRDRTATIRYRRPFQLARLIVHQRPPSALYSVSKLWGRRREGRSAATTTPSPRARVFSPRGRVPEPR